MSDFYAPPAYSQPSNWAPAVSAATGAIGSIGNMLLQYENRKYNERMQREAWAREDNAVQRRVADLRAAGLSPTLAAGSAADSSAPARSDPIQADVDKLNYLNQYYGLLSQKKDLARQDQEINKLKLQNQQQEYINAYMNPKKFDKLGQEIKNLAARSFAAYGSGSNNYAQAALHNRTMSFLNRLEDTFGWFLPGNYQFSNKGLFKGNLDFGILASALGMDSTKMLFNELPYSEVANAISEVLSRAGDKLSPIAESIKDWWSKGDPTPTH